MFSIKRQNGAKAAIFCRFLFSCKPIKTRLTAKLANVKSLAWQLRFSRYNADNFRKK
jgi:hypothetical protein